MLSGVKSFEKRKTWKHAPHTCESKLSKNTTNQPTNIIYINQINDRHGEQRTTTTQIRNERNRKQIDWARCLFVVIIYVFIFMAEK